MGSILEVGSFLLLWCGSGGVSAVSVSGVCVRCIVLPGHRRRLDVVGLGGL